jgi:putative addiction module component (TIGR02574 family)
MNKIPDAALRLATAERMVIAERLVESVEAEAGDHSGDDEIHRAWAEEVQRRSREPHAGRVKG